MPYLEADSKLAEVNFSSEKKLLGYCYLKQSNSINVEVSKFYLYLMRGEDVCNLLISSKELDVSADSM